MKIRFMEDNDAAITIIESGINKTMRHMGRTHNIYLPGRCTSSL